MKFQILKANKTEEIAKGIAERFILPKKVIEMRWIEGKDWCQFVANPGTDWKTLCRIARKAKQQFKLHLAKGSANG